MKDMEAYDLIGDLHGHAEPLRRLLGSLGYHKNGSGWSHPEGRKVAFLGDYIDRGPEIRETLEIVRGMVEDGRAVAIMGNHEFNALAFATPDGRGGWLRPHNKEKTAQHQATLEQFRGREDEWKEWLEWFRRLPLFLEMPGFRMVHAAWNDGATDAFRGLARLDDDCLHEMARKGSPLNRAKEILLNGMELELPEGHYFSDKTGFRRKDIRLRWWMRLEGKTYREAVFPVSETVPHLLIPEDLIGGHEGYPPDAEPLFIGHYWLPDSDPREPITPNIACLDYSVAKGGRLTAYRWEGERHLNGGKFLGH
jgi:hypothetical protein